MDPCWKNLPIDLVRKIIEFSNEIDIRIAFGISPKPLKSKRIRRIEKLLATHEGLFYNFKTKSLHIFRMPGVYMVRRPLAIHSVSEWGLLLGGDHTIEIALSSGSCVMTQPVDDYYFTELKVKFVL